MSLITDPVPVPDHSLRVRIPFVSTSFAQDLWYYALLWPVWWALGIDQLLLPFFVIYEMVRSLIRNNWLLRLNTTTKFASLLALWWVVPIIWADREFLDIFLKETSSIWSQALILILLLNEIRSRRDWWLVVGAISIMATYTAASSLIFAAGIWQGSFPSAVGVLLPSSLVENSAFFSSIAIRRFGSFVEVAGLFPFRLMGISWSFSALSMICLLLIPFTYWRFQFSRGYTRLHYLIVLVGLLVGLLFTESRFAYLGFLAGVALYCILRLGLLREPNLPLTIALILVGTGTALLFGYLALGPILETFRSTFIDLRPGSWFERLNIYVVTLQLLPKHFIAGWGVPVRIPGTSSVYSAGTHSSYLGMLFQHGVVGLLLYMGLWLSIWRAVFRGLRRHHANQYESLFWMAITFAFLAFNLREAADTWWWDLTILFVIWLQWGLVMTAPQALNPNKSHG
ncbi:MAG: O-antigen ligase family protein [Anaerolineae bacterium]|nr:O-antigen ligase family protein [Anaerolineae bacterium]RIK22411.1 MAG: hypothetical protein DCC51_05130 [Anaerolineae bacterium]